MQFCKENILRTVIETNLHLDVTLDCSVCSVAGIFTKLDAGPSIEGLSLADTEDFLDNMTPFVIFSGFWILQRQGFEYWKLIQFTDIKNIYSPFKLSIYFVIIKL